MDINLEVDVAMHDTFLWIMDAHVLNNGVHVLIDIDSAHVLVM